HPVAYAPAACVGRGCDLVEFSRQRGLRHGDVAGLLPLGPLARGEDDDGRPARGGSAGRSAGTATIAGRRPVPGGLAAAGAQRGLKRERPPCGGRLRSGSGAADYLAGSAFAAAAAAAAALALAWCDRSSLMRAFLPSRPRR